MEQELLDAADEVAWQWQLGNGLDDGQQQGQEGEVARGVADRGLMDFDDGLDLDGDVDIELNPDELGEWQLRLHQVAEGVPDMQVPHEPGDDGSEPGSVLSFSDNEEDEVDTTAEQVATGRDMQGIPWDRLQFSREHYRATRLKQYHNYVNVLPDNPDEYRPQILEQCQRVHYGSCLYRFEHNSRAVSTTIVHFQLRNLVWATSRNDVFVVAQNSVNHWNPVTRTITEVMNLSGGGHKAARAPGVGKVQVSTLCVREGLVATGGFAGELIVKRLGDEGWVYAGRISHSENGITNGLEVYNTRSHGPRVIASNNDCLVRVFDIQHAGFKCVSSWEFPWAVNYASVQPGSGQVAAVVGDDPVTCLIEMSSGKTVARLEGHADFSFAVAWHPDGNLLATGNQDTTSLVWDMRHTARPLARLAGRMGAIRSLRWSPDGRYLASSEPADFVHVYDASRNFTTAQEIDLFGEISGVSFTPAGDQLFVAVSDITYASLVTFNRVPWGGSGAAGLSLAATESPFLVHPQDATRLHGRQANAAHPRPSVAPHIELDA